MLDVTNECGVTWEREAGGWRHADLDAYCCRLHIIFPS